MKATISKYNVINHIIGFIFILMALTDILSSKEKLGWIPKYDLAGLVEDMMSSDIILMEKQQYLKDGGYTIKNYFE